MKLSTKQLLGNSEGVRHPLVWAGVIGTTLLLLLLFRAIIWISLPLMIAVIIYYICAPGVDWLRRMGLSHQQSVACLSLLILIGGTLTVLASLPWVSSQVNYLKQNLGTYYDNGNRSMAEATSFLEARFPWMSDLYNSEEGGAQIKEFDREAMAKKVRALLAFIASWFPAMLIVPYLTFYFLRDGPSFKKLLMRGVPNAFFEKVLLLFHRMDQQIHQYFRGMFLLTILDTITLGAGLSIVGHPFHIFDPSLAFFLGLACAVLSWLPYIGSILGLILILFVSATEAPGQPSLLFSVGILFLIVRLADDFVYSPMTVGKSLNIHPMLTVVMIFVGGSVAGIPGLFLVLPVLGICMVVGEMVEQVWFDESLRARHAHAVQLRKMRASESLQ